jgi:hypothetical protein
LFSHRSSRGNRCGPIPARCPSLNPASVLLFGQPFGGPMEGLEPLMPRELHRYDLHVWLFKANPTGLFHHINRDVDCTGKGPYAMNEEPTPIVEHHK